MAGCPGTADKKLKFISKAKRGEKVLLFTNIQGASLKVCKDHGDNQPPLGKAKQQPFFGAVWFGFFAFLFFHNGCHVSFSFCCKPKSFLLFFNCHDELLPLLSHTFGNKFP